MEKPNPIVSAPAPAKVEKSDQTVNVRALRTFHKGGDMSGEIVHPGDEFECLRQRAAELRANGLIEYLDDKHGVEIHGEADAKRIDEHVQRQAEAGKLPENSKTTPLRNPDLKLADVKTGKGA